MLPNASLRRRLAAVAVLIAAPLLLTGCVRIYDVQATQLDRAGAVEITTSLCQDDDTGGTQAPGTLDSNGCLTDQGGDGAQQQVLISYLIPSGATAPETINGSGDRGVGVLTAVSEADNAALTNGASPVPADMRWVSYRSEPFTSMTASESRLYGAVVARFGVPPGAPSTFRYGILVARRDVDVFQQAQQPDRPVVCGSATDCIDSFAPSNFAVLFETNVSSVDLTAPARVTAAPGTTASLTIQQTSVLAPGATDSTLPVSATTSLPGGNVTAPSNLTLGSSTPLAVTVTVPAGTPPGDYGVTLAVGENTARQTVTGTVRVPAPAQAQEQAASIPQQLGVSATALSLVVQRSAKTKRLRRGAISVPVDAPAAGLLRVSIVSRTRVGDRYPAYAVGTAEATKAGRVNVRLRRTASGRRAFASGEAVQAKLIVRLWTSGNRIITTAIPITIP